MVGDHPCKLIHCARHTRVRITNQGKTNSPPTRLGLRMSVTVAWNRCKKSLHRSSTMPDHSARHDAARVLSDFFSFLIAVAKHRLTYPLNTSSPSKQTTGRLSFVYVVCHLYTLVRMSTFNHHLLSRHLSLAASPLDSVHAESTHLARENTLACGLAVILCHTASSSQAQP